jgi:hypothetical protein
MGIDTLVASSRPGSRAAPTSAPTALSRAMPARESPSTSRFPTLSTRSTSTLPARPSSPTPSPAGSPTSASSPCASPPPSIDLPITPRQFTAFNIEAAIDAWARDIEIHETQNTTSVSSSAKRVTLDNVRVIHAGSHTGAAAPADFAISGTQILLNKCSVRGQGVWPVVTQATVVGPNVVLGFIATLAASRRTSGGATGLLVDRLALRQLHRPASGHRLLEPTAGSGHGWDVGWAVAWNVTTPFLLAQNPPGAINWCIGCKGEAVDSPPAGNFDAQSRPSRPPVCIWSNSAQRLGEAAVRAIGY